MVQKKEAKKAVCDDYLEEWRRFLKQREEQHQYFDIDDWLAGMGAEAKQALIYSSESESIIRKMSFRIYEANYRVLFVWMPERMHLACANKLLKLIEEPPAKTAVLMVTDTPDAVLGTIVSRSQILYTPPIDQDTLTKAMTDYWNVDVEEARRISHRANGSYLKAANMLAVDRDAAYFLEKFIQMMRNGWSRDIVAMKNMADELSKLGRETQKNFLAFCQRQIRENFVRCLGEADLNYMDREEETFSEKFFPYVNERNIVELMDEFSLAEQHIGQNVNSKMVFFDLSMRTTVLLKR